MQIALFLVCTIPFWTSNVIRTISWIPLLGRNGLVNSALLKLNGVELMLNTAYEDHPRPSVPDPARIAAHDDTAIYFGCPDVDAAYAHLRARGVAVKEPEGAHYGMKQLHVSDPDGYNLCFQWPAR